MRRELERISAHVKGIVDGLPMDYDRGRELSVGADGTPTTDIDKLAEDEVVRYVRENELPVNILSEEIGFVDRGEEVTLVVDPIDGTNNAIMGLPFFSVSLALGRRSLQDVHMGLVQNLVSGETFYAEEGKGAYLDGERIRVREFDPANSLFLVYMGRWASDATIHVAKASERTRSLGCASLEMCMVALGMVDAYYMNCERYDKSIRVVDIAASTLVLREAGGEVLNLDGRPLDMRFNLEERNNFAAVSGREVSGVII
ncbi:MAG: inositol monophosphatase family protein [Methanomassiliicoccales archaeon]